MVDDDLIFKSRPRKYGLASELGNVRVACRLMDGHPSTFYRWREQVLRSAEVTEMCRYISEAVHAGW